MCVYLRGRCCCILAISPILGSERMYMVARIAMTTKSHEEGLAGYTPLITRFCLRRKTRSGWIQWDSELWACRVNYSNPKMSACISISLNQNSNVGLEMKTHICGSEQCLVSRQLLACTETWETSCFWAQQQQQQHDTAAHAHINSCVFVTCMSAHVRKLIINVY